MAPPLLVPLLVAYLLAMLAIGLSERRRSSGSRESFYLADRSLSPFRTFAGLASTTTGGSTTIVLCAAVATRGFPGFWFDLAGGLGLVALGLFLAGKVRRLGAITLPEIAGRLFGPAVRRTAAVLVVLSEIVWFALLTQATQTVLTAALGIDSTLALVGSASVFIGYTFLGGQYAVIRTDVVQYAIMWGGLIGIALPSALLAVGPGSLWSGLPAGFLEFPTGPRMGGWEVAALLATLGLPHLVGSDVYAKLLSARDERAARIAALGAGVAKLVFGAGIAAIGVAAVSLGTVAGVETLPRTILATVPPILAAVVIVALVATMQSSCDSVLLTAVATTTEDLLPRGPESSSAPPGMRLARALAIGYGAAGLAVALLLRDLLDTLRLGYTLFAAGLILPILFGFAGTRVRPSAAWARAAMIAGGGVSLTARFLRPVVERALASAGLPTALADPILPGLAACGAVLVAGSVAALASGRCPGEDLVPPLRADRP